MIVTVLACGLLLLYSAGGASSVATVDLGRSRTIGEYDGSLTKALAAIGATETSLCIDARATVDGDTTVPATLELVFRKGGRIKFGAHKMRFNGPITAGPYRIFEGSGELTMAVNAAAELYVEWWGGSADGVTDNTPAFAKAIATMAHPRIKLLQGTYLGVVTATAKSIALHGSGKAATTLRNNAPEKNTISVFGGGIDTTITDLKVDINGAKESGIHLAGCTYADIARLYIVGQGGEGKYAMHLYSCTVSSINDILFGDDNNGHLYVDKSYYSNFRNITSGRSGTLPVIKIVNTAALHFYGVAVEHGHNGTIVIENAQNVNFYGTAFEVSSEVPAKTAFIRVKSSHSINFYGGRVFQYAHKGLPIFELADTRGCIIDGWLMKRYSEDTSPFITLGAGLHNVQISNIEFASNISATAVSSKPGPENKVSRLILENLIAVGGQLDYLLNATDLETRNVEGVIKSE
jgi:hypothetical protein